LCFRGSDLPGAGRGPALPTAFVFEPVQIESARSAPWY
jgi:hypothetical protein